MITYFNPVSCLFFFFFFFTDTATTEIYTLSLHDALPIPRPLRRLAGAQPDGALRVDLVHLLLGDPGLLRHVEAAGEDPVQDGRHREADERGDVATAEII